MKIGLINIALQLYKLNKFKNLNNVIDLGSKELRVSFSQLVYAFKQANINFEKKNFNILKKFPKGKRISTKFFWKELGTKNHFCLDINKEQNSLYHDLNYPLKNNNLLNKFDLVTDFGNNEHIFNIGEAYKTMYQICKKNGFLWIFQSVYNGNGFYNFDQSFFEGLAAANQMSIVHSCYLVHTNEYEQFVIPCNKDLLNTFDLTKVKNISISYIFRKTNNKNFRYYYQYNLKNKNEVFNLNFINSSIAPEKIYIPLKKINELKKQAKKGDKASINYLRAINVNFN